MASDLTMMAAGARIIYDLGLATKATLTQDLTAGDTKIYVDDASAFAEGGLVIWPDGWFIYEGRTSEAVSAGSNTVTLLGAGENVQPAEGQIVVGQDLIFDIDGRDEETVTVTDVTVAGGKITAITADFALDHGTGVAWQTVPMFDEPVVISSAPGSVNLTENSIQCFFQGAGYDGFRFSQSAGTTITPNVITEAPIDVSKLLSRGLPLFSVMARSEQSNLPAVHVTQEEYLLAVIYRAPLLAPRASKLDPNVWGIRQQDAARRNLRKLLREFTRNENLTTSDGVKHALNLGQSRGGRSGQTLQRAWIDWSRAVVDDKTAIFQAPLFVRVRALPTSF